MDLLFIGLYKCRIYFGHTFYFTVFHVAPHVLDAHVLLPEEIVDDERLIAISDCVEVDVVVVVAEEQQAQPRRQCVHGNNEQDPYRRHFVIR